MKYLIRAVLPLLFAAVAFGASCGQFALNGLTGQLDCVGTAGAVASANILVTSLDGTLTNERVITAGTGIGFVDGGAGSTFTVSVDTAVMLSRATDQAGTDAYCRSTTGTDTYTCALTPTLTAYTRGGCLVLDGDTANTGAATVNVDTLGAKSILTRVSGALLDGDIPANKPTRICYDGTQFIVQGGSGNVSTDAAATFGAFSYDFSASTVSLPAVHLRSDTSFTMTAGETGVFTPAAAAPGIQLVAGANPTGNWPGALNIDVAGGFNWSPSNGVFQKISTAATANRTFALPDANSNSVVPADCGSQAVKAISSAGVITCISVGSLSGLTTNGILYATSSTAATTQDGTGGHIFAFDATNQYAKLGAYGNSTTPAVSVGYNSAATAGFFAFNSDGIGGTTTSRVYSDGSNWVQNNASSSGIMYFQMGGNIAMQVNGGTNVEFVNPPRVPRTVVGSLPTCNAGAEGTIYGATDLLTPTFLATAVGGGAVRGPVYCNGTNWVTF